MNNPLVSIIIPTYNRAHIISETLDSIISQTYQNWECIVVDDRSTDNTEGVIGEYLKLDSRFSYYQRPESRVQGPNSCRNFGFEKSKGAFIQWFDSDDLLLSNAIGLLIKSSIGNPDAIVAKTDCFDFLTDTRISTNKVFSHNLIEDYFTGKITFYIGGILWNRTFLLKQDELFDINIRNMDDWDFNLRMLYEKPKIVFLDDILFQYRLHKDSFSNELRKLNKLELISEFKARDKHLAILEKRKDINKEVIHTFLLRRHKKYLKMAIIKSDKNVYFLFNLLFLKQLEYGRFNDSLKTAVGFLVFFITGRGYIFFKDYP
ncbi:glycosyltransferase family 2 protein [Aequorivita vladivostokensis]|uniref:glycosyltransferase family 2 protein n=1 Tax=Aequorivita vladivostokensis TaxID=171194 RepID=UPI0006973CD2|nr:glycosyltransferase [Aequorivita vladivostokensis]